MSRARTRCSREPRRGPGRFDRPRLRCRSVRPSPVPRGRSRRARGGRRAHRRCGVLDDRVAVFLGPVGEPEAEVVGSDAAEAPAQFGDDVPVEEAPRRVPVTEEQRGARSLVDVVHPARRGLEPTRLERVERRVGRELDPHGPASATGSARAPVVDEDVHRQLGAGCRVGREVGDSGLASTSSSIDAWPVLLRRAAAHDLVGGIGVRSSGRASVEPWPRRRRAGSAPPLSRSSSAATGSWLATPCSASSAASPSVSIVIPIFDRV